MRAHSLQRTRGFTLMELMIALAIVGIIGAIALPNFYSNMPKRRLKADAMDIANNMKYAKLNAVKRNVDVGLYFYPDKEAYGIFADSNGNHQFDDPGDQLLKPIKELRQGISCDRGHADWSLTNNRVIFSPNGSANVASGTVVLENTREQLRKIVVAPITGRIRVTE